MNRGVPVGRTVRVLIILMALALGVGVAVLSRSPGAETTGLVEGLWLNRQVDLLLQVGLILVGALGIHALMPGPEEEEEHHGPLE